LGNPQHTDMTQYGTMLSWAYVVPPGCPGAAKNLQNLQTFGATKTKTAIVLHSDS
jgi:hypothetical protein